jgi:hypothetical protein
MKSRFRYGSLAGHALTIGAIASLGVYGSDHNLQGAVFAFLTSALGVVKAFYEEPHKGE